MILYPTISINNKIILLFVFYSILITPLIFSAPYFLLIDYAIWNQDYDKLLNCVEFNIRPCVEISKFPAAYLINSYFLNFFRNYNVTPETTLFLLNSFFLSLPLIFFLIVRGLKFAIIAGIIYTCSILLSPVPSYYLYSGGIEVQSGIMTGLFISSLLLSYGATTKLNKPCLILFLFVTAIIFPLYKDTNLIVIIFTIVLSKILYQLISGKQREENKNINRLSINNIFKISAILIIPVSIICSYNLLKYESVLPVAYLQEANFTSPSLIMSIEFLFASFYSLNGGILTFWFVSFLTSLLLIHYLGMEISRIAKICCLILVISSAIGFSLWWAPFGWDSWGNRMMIPSVLASLIILISTLTIRTKKIYSEKDSLRNIIAENSKVKNITGIVFTLIIVFLSVNFTLLPYFYDKSTLVKKSMYPGYACLSMLDVAIDIINETGNLELYPSGFWRSDLYYDCARERFLHFPGWHKLTY